MKPWLAAIVDRVSDALGVLVADPKNLELAAVREARKARP